METEAILGWCIIMSVVAVTPHFVLQSILLLRNTKPLGAAMRRGRRWAKRYSKFLGRGRAHEGESASASSDGNEEGESDEIQDMVDQLVSERRTSCARRALGMLWAAAFVRGMFMVVSSLGAGNEMDLEVEVAFTVGLIALTAATVFPKTCINSRTLPFCQWGATIGICVLFVMSSFASLGRTPEESQAVLVLVSLTLAGLNLQFAGLAIQNICMSACFMYYASANKGEDFSVLARTSISEIVMCIWRLVLFHWMESTLEDSAQNEVTSSLGRCQESAVSSLLGMMCDAVVDLDQSLFLKDHYVKLAGMLMHGNGGKTLKGVPLTEFMSQDQDKEVFQGVISASEAKSLDQLTSSMIKVRMRDSVDNVINTIFYHVPYSSSAGNLNHLIGIREDPSGRGVDPEESEEDDSVSDLSSAHTVRRSTEMLHRSMPEAALRPEVALCLGYSRQSPAEAASTSAVSSASGDSRRGEDGPMTVDVMAQDGLPVSFATDNFKNRFGLHGQDRFFMEVLQDGGEPFVSRVKDIAESVQSGNAAPHIANFGYLQLTPLVNSEARPLRHYLVSVYFPPARQEPYCFSIKIKRGPRISRGSNRGTRAVSVPRSLNASRADDSEDKMVAL